MKKDIRIKIEKFVTENINMFHNERLKNISSLKLKALIENKNPYLLRAKNLHRAQDLVEAILAARLSSSEEGSFGGFLEALAIFVAQICFGGQKSSTTGIDIDLRRDDKRYLIAVKSGNKWGNKSQHDALKRNFKTAVMVLKQNKYAGEIIPTEGICYARFQTKHKGDYLHIGGQAFWELLSSDSQLYADIIIPIGHDAERHNLAFEEQKAAVSNKLTREFILQYCTVDGLVDWPKLVKEVCENTKPKPSTLVKPL